MINLLIPKHSYFVYGIDHHGNYDCEHVWADSPEHAAFICREVFIRVLKVEEQVPHFAEDDEDLPF